MLFYLLYVQGYTNEQKYFLLTVLTANVQQRAHIGERYQKQNTGFITSKIV